MTTPKIDALNQSEVQENPIKNGGQADTQHNPAANGNDQPALNADYLAAEVQHLEAEVARLRLKLEQPISDQGEGLSKAQKESNLKPYQAELVHLQHYLEKTKRPMVILFEGRDASGKGGTIRRVARYMNEKHYRLVALGKPTDTQRTQWFFQRYIEQFPSGGETVLFDRSWYNRAMVEPVFGFCSNKEYEHFMRGVVGFESNLVENGIHLVKLYFSVNKNEQSDRFARRSSDPLRQWKLSEVDLQAQEKWDVITSQKYRMLKRTHTAMAPWRVVRSDNKYLARLNALKTILCSVPYPRKDQSLDLRPDPNICYIRFA